MLITRAIGRHSSGSFSTQTFAPKAASLNKAAMLKVCTVTQFFDLGLAKPLLRALDTAGYAAPTPIQEVAIPTLLAGHDVLGIAQTGTGKTAAFVLPTLHYIATLKGKPEPNTCRALILAPTRELAAQIIQNLRTYSKHLRLSSTIVVGGVKHGPQIRALDKGVDVLVATPGRLEDHMASGKVKLSDTRIAVLDEADHMLDLGFIPAIRRIMGAMPEERQTALFSATMPKQIRALAHDFLRAPKEISVAPVAKPIEQISQSVLWVAREDKRNALANLLVDKGAERAIVFTRTKYGADKLARFLTKAGFKSAAIHGDKSQGQRERALKAFKAGDASIMVATDIAARGIDIDDVTHVFNFELPDVPDAYVHRIGRTARAGRSGVAVALVDPEERGLLWDVEHLIGMELAVEDGSLPVPDKSKGKPKGKGRKKAKPAPGRGRAKTARPQGARSKSGTQNRSKGGPQNRNKKRGARKAA